MDALSERVEYDCIISFEVKLIGERWTIYSEGIKEDLFVTIVVSETVTRHGLEQLSKVS